jgi:hypothetical protein
METTSGRTRSKIDFGVSFLSPKPTSTLEQMAIAGSLLLQNPGKRLTRLLIS